MNIKKNKNIEVDSNDTIKNIEPRKISKVKEKVKLKTLSLMIKNIELMSDMNLLGMMANSRYSGMIKSGEGDNLIHVLWASKKIIEGGGLKAILKDNNISPDEFIKDLKIARNVPDELIATNSFIVTKKWGKLYSTIQFNSEYNFYYINFTPTDIKDDHISHNFRMMVDFVEMRDIETAEHQKRVTKVSVLLSYLLSKTKAYKSQINNEFIVFMNLSAGLHDLGKIGIENKILLKPGKLTDEEFNEIKSHCEIGGKIVKKLENKFGKKKLLTFAHDLVLHHHERYDGKGYPYGLKGDEIPLSAQIVSIVDVFDAVLSKRPYKEAFSKDEAKKIIESGKGTQFNELIVEVFIHNYELLFLEREKLKL